MAGIERVGLKRGKITPQEIQEKYFGKSPHRVVSNHPTNEFLNTRFQRKFATNRIGTYHEPVTASEEITNSYSSGSTSVEDPAIANKLYTGTS